MDLGDKVELRLEDHMQRVQRFVPIERAARDGGIKVLENWREAVLQREADDGWGRAREQAPYFRLSSQAATFALATA